MRKNDCGSGNQYPSGRTVQTGYDGAGRAAWLQGNFSGVLTNYVANPNDTTSWIHYWPHGAVYYYALGNGVTHAVSFNARLQQIESYEAINNDPGQVLFLSCPNWGVTANTLPWLYDLCPHATLGPNNGNLQAYDEYNGGPGYPLFLHFSQTFGYDPLNRLQTASDSGGWSRTFNYDPYGNMWVSNVTGPATGAYTGNVYGVNNRAVNVPYDQAGNLLVANGNILSYDAENRQIAAIEPAAYGGGTEQYLYDGDGRRVEKTGPSGTTVYVYDAAGQLAAEYSTAPATSPCTTCYLATDHLGSVRLITDQKHTVISRHDFFPFGEEIAANQAGRDSHFGPGNDTVNQKFTGKERDAESGLDYFGARYYGSALGRFTSPDEFKGGIVDPFTGQDIETNTALPYADITDPQTLNKYAYVRNNPLRYTDPNGHCVEAFTCTVEFGTAGAEIGSIGGPIGTAAGALIGGAIGAFTGYEIYKGAQAVVSLATKDESSQQAQPAPTRGQALSDAKNDAGVPTSQQPSKQATVPLTDLSGKPVVIDGQKQNTREYTHTTGSGETVVIQDHSQGHTFPDGGQVGQHFNVRPADNTRNGSVPGTKPHYPYAKPGDEQ